MIKNEKVTKFNKIVKKLKTVEDKAHTEKLVFSQYMKDVKENFKSEIEIEYHKEVYTHMFWNNIELYKVKILIEKLMDFLQYELNGSPKKVTFEDMEAVKQLEKNRDKLWNMQDIEEIKIIFPEVKKGMEHIKKLLSA